MCEWPNDLMSEWVLICVTPKLDPEINTDVGNLGRMCEGVGKVR